MKPLHLRPPVRPVVLRPNLVDHFYRGGARIAALRGIETTSDHQPEEWIASTVARENDPVAGLSVTDGGDLLRDLVVADPEGWLGGATQLGGGDTGLLLKLLDAGQRLPTHVHPDRAFAARHLDCPYGKTEAWVVLEADPDAAVYVGWSSDVDPDEVAAARDAQDSDWLVGHMNRIPVRRGDGVLVPARSAHAIGEGVFLAEPQEPTDFSILLEWSVTTQTREESHLGLGFDLAMQALRYDATTDLDALVVHRDIDGDLDAATAPLTSLLPAAADPFFRMQLATAGASLPAGFAALVALGGEGDLLGADGQRVAVNGGDALAVPAGFGDWTVDGSVRLMVARPGTEVPRG